MHLAQGFYRVFPCVVISVSCSLMWRRQCMTRSRDRILCWLFRRSMGATQLIANSPVQVVSLEIDRCSIAIDAIWMTAYCSLSCTMPWSVIVMPVRQQDWQVSLSMRRVFHVSIRDNGNFRFRGRR